MDVYSTTALYQYSLFISPLRLFRGMLIQAFLRHWIPSNRIHVWHFFGKTFWQTVRCLVLTSGWSLDRVQTHAGHSITWNMLLHFVTLWPWPLIFWPNIKWVARTHNGLSHSKFGDCSFSCFGSTAETDRHTRDKDEHFTPATLVIASNKLMQLYLIKSMTLFLLLSLLYCVARWLGRRICNREVAVSSSGLHV